MESPTRVRYQIVGTTTLVAVLLYLDRICIGTIADRPDFKEAFGIGDEGSGAIKSAFFYAYALAQVPAGWLADRYGARGMLTFYLVAWSVCTALTGLASGLVMLIAARALFGIAQAGCYPTAGGLIKRWIPVEGRGRASSIVSIGGRVGGVIAPALTAWLLADYLSWRGVLLLYGISGMFVAALVWRNIRECAADHPQANKAEQQLVTAKGPSEETGPPRWPPLMPLIKSGSMWLMCLLQFAINIGWVFVAMWLTKYLMDYHNVAEKTAGVMKSTVLGVGVCGLLLGGPLADWLVKRHGALRGRRIQLVGAYVCAAAAYGVVMLLDSPWAIVGALAVVAFMVDLSIPPIWAHMMDVGGRNAAAVFGWGNMWGNIGAGVSINLVPVVNRHFDRNADWHETFAMFAIALVIAAIAAIGLNPKRAIE